MFCEEIRIRSFLQIILSIKDFLQQQNHLMATSLETNAVVLTRVYRTNIPLLSLYLIIA